MRIRQADPQEECLGLDIALELTGGEADDEIVRLNCLADQPIGGSELSPAIRRTVVGQATRPACRADVWSPVSFVKARTPFQTSGVVLTARAPTTNQAGARTRLRLTDVDRVATSVLEFFDATPLPGIAVAESPCAWRPAR